MISTSTITQKGQITLPIGFRKKLSLKPKDRVMFAQEEDGVVSIRKVPDFFALKGSVKSKKPFDPEAMAKSAQDLIVQNYAQQEENN